MRLSPPSSSPLAFGLLILLLVLLPACGDAAEEDAAPAASSDATEAATSADTATASGPAQTLDLNSADAEDFLTIPDVGDRMAGEFLEYRPYVSIQQFRQEIGKYVDEAQVAAYEQYVYVPIAYDDSDAPTLQQIPGVDAAIAEELMSGRPYDSADAFLQALGAYDGVDMEAARRYLEGE